MKAWSLMKNCRSGSGSVVQAARLMRTWAAGPHAWAGMGDPRNTSTPKRAYSASFLGLVGLPVASLSQSGRNRPNIRPVIGSVRPPTCSKSLTGLPFLKYHARDKERVSPCLLRHICRRDTSPGCTQLRCVQGVLYLCYTTVRQSTMHAGSDSNCTPSTGAAMTVLVVSGSRREDVT